MRPKAKAAIKIPLASDTTRAVISADLVEESSMPRTIMVGFWPSGARVAHDGGREVVVLAVGEDTAPWPCCGTHIVDGPPKEGCAFTFESKKIPT